MRMIKIGSMELADKLNLQEEKALEETLVGRFEKNMHRHEKVTLDQMVGRLRSETRERAMWSLNAMEVTGGEPDAVARNPETGELRFEDGSAESPMGRRNCAYDKDGEIEAISLGNKPNGNAVDMAAAMGITILNESEYLQAQKVDRLDSKTWSWVLTPVDKRERGLAIHGRSDYRSAFVCEYCPDIHAGNRAFRGSLTV